MTDRRQGATREWQAVAKQTPWKLSPSEAEALEALTQTFCVKAGARVMGVGGKGFEGHLGRARRKMKAFNSLHAALLWDRWRRPSEQRNFGFPPDHEALEHAAPATSPFPQLGRHVVPSAGVHAAAKG